MEEMKELIFSFAGFSALTIGLCQVVKQLTDKLDRFIPTLALIIGVGLNVLYYGVSVEHAIVGIAIGLSSMGLFSGGKKTIKG